jgi:hypothetical protein
MFAITEAAGSHLSQILDRESCPEETAVRLVYDGRGFAMQPDSKREGDATFEHEGRLVLLLDEQVSQLLADHTLDMDGDNLALKGSADQA